MVFSSSSMIAVTSKLFNNDAWYFTKKQIMWATLGTFGMLIIMNIPAQKLKKWYKPYFIVIIVLLVLVLIIGEEFKGSRSWFGIGSFGIQPTEFAKLAVILYLSFIISKKGDKFRDLKKGLIPVLTVVGGIAGLILMQPDFGSCMILLSTSMIVIVAGGANLKHLFAAGGMLGGIAGLFLTVYLLAADEYGYRIQRLTSYIDPWKDQQESGYQLIQSLYAFGHGGLTGTGIGQSIQKLHYLPEPYNDFIFAIIGEELGFIGSTIFLLAYLGLLWRGLIIALRCEDNFSTLVGVGIVGMIGIQALVNIGGVTGAIPITGVTLPLISYGGSSLLITLASIGILLSMSRDHNNVDVSRTKKRERSM